MSVQTALKTARAEPKNRADLLDLAQQVLSPVTGLVRRVVFQPRSADEIPIAYPGTLVPDYSRIPGMQPIDPTGGSGVDPVDALARVLFETMERYCGAFVDRDRMIWGKPRSEEFLHGADFPLYADFQYARSDWPFCRLTSESAIWWAEGTSLFTGRRAFVPAVFTHVPYVPASPAEWLGPSTSTGMAASWSWDGACLAGLLEVCEREAFAIAWMNALPMPRLKLDPRCALARRLEGLLSGPNVELTFVNISSDLEIPTVAAVLRHPYLGRPMVTIGAAAKPSFEAACEKAFAEAANGYGRIVSVLEERTAAVQAWRPEPDFSNITDWEWHGLAYADPALQEFLAFLTASEVEQVVPPEAGDAGASEALARYLPKLREKFREIVVVDLTTRELADLGVCVVKVVVPDAVPLHPDHRFPWLGHARLYEVPRLLGYSRTDTRPDRLNTRPHPFS